MIAKSLLLLLEDAEELTLSDAEQLLDYGIKTNQVDMVRKALNSGRIFALTNHFFQAVEHESKDVVKLFLDEFGVDVDIRSEGSNETALYKAVRDGDIDLAKLLLDHSADVNIIKDYIGFTPLHIASLYYRTDIAKLLLDNGADVNARTKRGTTPLAIAGDNESISNLLIQYGATKGLGKNFINILK